MARLWSSGIELQSVTAGVEFDVVTGSPTVNTSIKRSGAASLRCNPTAATSYVQHVIMTGTTTTAHVYLRAYVYVASLPSAKTMILSWQDNTSFGYGVRLQTDGKLKIEGTNSTLIGTASTLALSTGQWYLIELDDNDSTDVATCYVNGVQWCTLTGADTFGGDRIMFGSYDAVTTDIYFDDVAINDTSGSAQTGLAGAGSIVHLLPNAAGDNNGFATAVGGTAGAANNYTRVSEVTPDDATSYNNTTVTGTTTIDDFNVTDSATAGITSGSTVTLVQVGQRAASAATTTASIVTRLKGQASGTTTESASIPVNTTGWNTHATAAPKIYKITAYTNPQTSTAWTTTSLDSMQIGYRGNVSQSTSRRITSVWALVEYIPPVVTSGSAFANAGTSSSTTTVRTKSGSAFAGAGVSSTSTTVRTKSGSAFANAGTSSSSTTVRTKSGSAVSTATATGTSTTVRTKSGSAFANAGVSSSSTTVRTTSGVANATATARSLAAGVRTTTGLANATATATATKSTVRTTAGSAQATATATYTLAGETATSGTAGATATATGITTTFRTSTGAATAGAAARSVSAKVATSATGALCLAGARAVDTTVRSSFGSATAVATARGTTASETSSAMKVREGGVWVVASPKVRESGAWVVGAPKHREGGSWVPH